MWKVILTLALLAAVSIAEDKHTSCIEPSDPDVERMCMKILGHSGKIVLGFPINESSDDPMSNDEYLEIRYRSLFELDSDAEVVGKSGNGGKHSYNSFASMDFEIDQMKAVEIDGVEAFYFNMTATIENEEGPRDCKMKGDFWIFAEDGTVDVGGNGTIDVTAGDVKWNIGVDDWVWCDSTEQNCPKGGAFEEGSMMMLQIELSGPNGSLTTFQGNGAPPGQAPVSDTRGASGREANNPCDGPAGDTNKFCKESGSGVAGEFGEGKRIAILFEDTVRYGDSQSRAFLDWEKMMDGYPEVINQNATDGDLLEVNLMFERRAGRSAIEYDPIAASLPKIQDDWAPSSSASSISSISALIVLVVAALLR